MSTPICNWIMDFLTGRPQVLTIGSNTSSTLVLNTGATQGCCLSPQLYSHMTVQPYTAATGSSSSQTSPQLSVSNNDKKEYRDEVAQLTYGVRTVTALY